MAHWTGDTGILRKNKPKENHEELLVFGYACKLFRDDEKAIYIDQGKHLIPWMGDEKLKIDRYDCRGALADLKRYEASREGFDAMRWLGLSDSDRKLEELCDNERYYSLLINEEEEEMYKEEEQKRQNTNAFQYSYDVPMEPKPEAIPTVPEEEEEDYVPLPALDVPVNINLPKTVKEYARIEKTAKFVCHQGPQMEILIKAKQGDNPQFSFLNQGDSLYKFYRHVLSAFKSGRYQGQIQRSEESQEERHDDADGHYLHPSLLASKQQPENPPPPSTVPSIPYKPSANCAYSQLVNRIQGTTVEQPQDVAPKTQEVPQMFAQLTYEQQQYYQYYYTAQYYEYYKQLAQYQQNCGEHQGQIMPPPDFQLDPSMQAYFQQIAYGQYVQQHQQQQQQQQQQNSNNNSYAQIVSNMNKDSNPYSANVPSLPQNTTLVKPLETSEVDSSKEIKTVTRITNDSALKKPLLSLAQYGSDSEDEQEEETVEKKPDVKEVFLVPTGETQIVIDKMAVYVSKNGEQFEDIVRAKGDPRFEFLNTNHEYNKYYRNKIRELKGEKVKDVEVKVEKIKEEVKSPVKVKEEKEKKKVIAPVCFSIKKPKEEPPKEIKSALPIEESDEDEPEETGQDKPAAAIPEQSETATPEVKKEPEEAKPEIDIKNGIIDVDDPILEMIDLTFDAEEKKDAKRAEDRIKDKIALAAREKLASATRDKALQLERKKKAALFLKMKTGISVVPEKTSTSSDSKSRRNSSDVEIVKESRSVSRSASKERSKSKERKIEEKKKSVERDKKERRDKKSSPSKRKKSPSGDEKSKSSYHSARKSEDKDKAREERRSSDRTDRKSSAERNVSERKSSDRERRSSDRRSDEEGGRRKERSKSRDKDRRGRSPKKELEVIVEEGEYCDSDVEDKKKRKCAKKKKSHKRKRSKSKSDNRKKAKKRHRRSSSHSSVSS